MFKVKQTQTLFSTFGNKSCYIFLYNFFDMTFKLTYSAFASRKESLVIRNNKGYNFVICSTGDHSGAVELLLYI